MRQIGGTKKDGHMGPSLLMCYVAVLRLRPGEDLVGLFGKP